MKRFAVRIKCEVAEVPIPAKPRDLFQEQWRGPAPKTRHVILEVLAEDEDEAARLVGGAISRTRGL